MGQIWQLKHWYRPHFLLTPLDRDKEQVLVINLLTALLIRKNSVTRTLGKEGKD